MGTGRRHSFAPNRSPRKRYRGTPAEAAAAWPAARETASTAFAPSRERFSVPSAFRMAASRPARSSASRPTTTWASAPATFATALARPCRRTVGPRPERPAPCAPVLALLGTMARPTPAGRGPPPTVGLPRESRIRGRRRVRRGVAHGRSVARAPSTEASRWAAGMRPCRRGQDGPKIGAAGRCARRGAGRAGSAFAPFASRQVAPAPGSLPVRGVHCAAACAPSSPRRGRPPSRAVGVPASWRCRSCRR
jgi:hypothetical protein